MPSSRLFLFFFSFFAATFAGTVNLDWKIGWINANPDGQALRPVISINGQWPNPTIYANLGDQVSIHVTNNLGNETTSLHFHGLYQTGTNDMDGGSGVSQCPIPPNSSFTYTFQVNQPGTYWYHSHASAQYPDGLRGPLVVHDPSNPYAGSYDEEIVMTVSDWYHDQAPTLISRYHAVGVPPDAVPIPDAALINDAQNTKFNIQPGKTYLVRAVNIGALAPIVLYFDRHNMTIVEIDGVYTKKFVAEQILLAPAQRYSFLITAKRHPTRNFAFLASMFQGQFPPNLQSHFQQHVNGYLIYDSAKPLPPPVTLSALTPIDDFQLVPYDQQPILSPVTQRITINMAFGSVDGIPRGLINHQTYLSQKVPTLYTALSAPDTDVTNPAIYGVASNPFVVGPNEVVEIVLNNLDFGGHPWHLHGHQFQTVARSRPHAGLYDPNNPGTLPSVPMRRDTVNVLPGGNIALRFKSGNPGVFLFHCHIEWHAESGLVATIIEDPLSLKHQLVIPPDHLQVCQKQGIPTAGNAAGNTANFLDLAGQITKVPATDDGYVSTESVSFVTPRTQD